MSKKVGIYKWVNPRQKARGTQLEREVMWTSEQNPATGDTFTLGERNYTVLNVNHNLDTCEVTIRAMATEDVNGDDEEDL